MLLQRVPIPTTPDNAAAGTAHATAVAALAQLATILLLARSLRPLADGLVYELRSAGWLADVTAVTWLRALAWAVVTATVFAGWRAAAAGGAWLVVAGEAVMAGERLARPLGANGIVFILWPTLLAMIAAGVLTVAALDRGAPRRLGWVSTAAFVSAGLVAVTAGTGPALLTEVYAPPTTRRNWEPGVMLASVNGEHVMFVAVISYVLIITAAGVGLLFLPGPARPGALLLTVPIGAFLLAANVGFAGGLSGALLGLPVLSQPIQVTLIVVSAMAAAALAAAPNRMGTRSRT